MTNLFVYLYTFFLINYDFIIIIIYLFFKIITNKIKNKTKKQNQKKRQFLFDYFLFPIIFF